MSRQLLSIIREIELEFLRLSIKPPSLNKHQPEVPGFLRRGVDHDIRVHLVAAINQQIWCARARFYNPLTINYKVSLVALATCY